MCLPVEAMALRTQLTTRRFGNINPDSCLLIDRAHWCAVFRGIQRWV